MYIKTKNNSIFEISETEKNGFYYIPINYDNYVENVKNNNYESSPFGVVLKDGLPKLKKVTKKNIVKKNNKKQCNTIETQLERIKKQFEKNIDMNVKWVNGLYYKPRYASESYEQLISAELAIRQISGGRQTKFPMAIWDATKKNCTRMTFEQLVELAKFLAVIYEKQFQKYKIEYAKLLDKENN